MKKKFNLWLNIVTICLCVCAIAVGVYSATTAKITAGGKVAFSAHNCKVELTGYIYGHGVKDGVDSADGLPVAEEQKEYLTTNNAPITVEGGVNTAVQSTISIGENRWFTDMASTDGKPADIVIGITVKNITIYDITVSVDLSKVTYPQDQVTVSCDTESVDLKQGENVTFEFTLSFDLISTGSTSTSYTGFGLTDLVIPIYSTKLAEQDPVYVNANKQLVVEMGHTAQVDGRTDLTIEWVAFAVKGVNLGNSYGLTIGSDKWYSLSGVDMTNVDRTGKTFWFIQKGIAAGEFMDYASLYGVRFALGNNNNYAESYVHQFINSTYISDQETGIISDKVYSQLTTRSVTETFSEVSFTCSFSSKLWLVNSNELKLMNGGELTTILATSLVNAQTINNPNVSNWSTREPTSDGEIYRLVGDNYSPTHLTAVLGVRPAFEIKF